MIERSLQVADKSKEVLGVKAPPGPRRLHMRDPRHTFGRRLPLLLRPFGSQGAARARQIATCADGLVKRAGC